MRWNEVGALINATCIYVEVVTLNLHSIRFRIRRFASFNHFQVFISFFFSHAIKMIAIIGFALKTIARINTFCVKTLFVNVVARLSLVASGFAL